MKTCAFCVAAGFAVSLASAAIADETKPAVPSATAQVNVQPEAAGITIAGAETRPKITVNQTPAADTHDSRVNIGGVKFSMPMTIASAPVQATPNTNGSQPNTTTPSRADGLIEVPNNTLGPGEALWQQNDRVSAELKLAGAEARFADRVADLPLDTGTWGFGSSFSSGWSTGWSNGWSNGWSGNQWGCGDGYVRGRGPFQNVGTVCTDLGTNGITRSGVAPGLLGNRAQLLSQQAALPRASGTAELRARALAPVSYPSTAQKSRPATSRAGSRSGR